MAKVEDELRWKGKQNEGETPSYRRSFFYLQFSEMAELFSCWSILQKFRKHDYLWSADSTGPTWNECQESFEETTFEEAR